MLAILHWHCHVCPLMQALQLAATSQASLDAITRLTTSALDALQNIEMKFETTVSAIKVALSSSIVTVDDALDLWKRARRHRLTSERDAQLINLPCSYVANPSLASSASPATTILQANHGFEVPGTLSFTPNTKCAVEILVLQGFLEVFRLLH
jgi:hypothetical protein